MRTTAIRLKVLKSSLILLSGFVIESSEVRRSAYWRTLHSMVERSLFLFDNLLYVYLCGAVSIVGLLRCLR